MGRVKRSNKYGLIGKDGNELAPCVYDVVIDCDGFAYVNKNGKWGCLNCEGEEIIPCKFKGMQTFFEGKICVCADDKWGVIDNRGNQIVPFIYDSPEEASATIPFDNEDERE